MADQRWLEISITPPPEQLDDVTAKLTMAGMSGLVIEDEGEFEEFLARNKQYWDYVDEDLSRHMSGLTRVRFYVTDDEDGRAQLTQYTQSLGYEYTVTPLLENDWAYSWQKYYKPMSVGDALYIVPEWERENEVPSGMTALYLNPGLTFGTGSHASTRLCLEAILQHIKPGTPVLDLGCGSGILSVAALVLGAESAVAVDIDPKAVGVAYENAALNNIDQTRYSVMAGDVLSDPNLAAQLAQRQYPLVVANIVADVIIPLSAQVPKLLQPDGVFICSGIIGERANEVSDAIERNGMRVINRRCREDWIALEAVLL